MRAISFVDGWTCRHLDDPGPGEPVRIPHDAARYEQRSATAPGGTNTGWYEAFDYLYEKRFTPAPELMGRTLLLEFEGVYRNAEVILNGEKLCFRPYGYTNFYVNLTGKLRDGEENVLQVIARNADQPNSRWYSGTGIYRPVRLWVGGERYIGPNGLRIRTLSLDPERVAISVRTEGTGRVAVTILDGEQVIASAAGDSVGTVNFELDLPGAGLWSPADPKLYTCRAEFEGDTAESTFGIRTISWDERGFLINGERFILNGACIHHDNGLLGAVCDPDAVSRKVRLLRENGYNAIRSAHNPCSKTILDECDRQGMLMMDEYIDHWYIHKTAHDYVDYFSQWWRQDLEDMVDKDYNHPSVVLYSIGNEVSETAQKRGVELTRAMTEHLHSLDSTRPVTCGVNIFFNLLSSMGFGVYSDEKAAKDARRAEALRQDGKPAKDKAVGSQFFNNLAGLLGDEFMKRGATLHGCDVKTRDAFAQMDIAGYNYGIYRYEHDLRKYPNRLILGSETFCSDAYRFRELAKKEPHLIGDFVWAGMDYLGEVMIGSWVYGEDAEGFDAGLGWVSSGSGRIDLTGKPLGESLYTRVALEAAEGPFIAVRPVNHSGEKHSPSAWKMTDAEPTWSWRGCEGRTAEVEVYSRASRVRLLLNGKVVGDKGARNDCRFKFSIPYENGELTAIALDGDRKETGRVTLTTAGEETELRLEPETAQAAPDHLLYVRIRYTDEEGLLKPMERGTVKVGVTGGSLLALGSGCPYNKRGFLTDETDTYYGEALAIIRAGDAGDVVLTASDGTLQSCVTVPIARDL